MGESDAELIRRWQAGDEPAFAVLVRRWEAPLARFLSRLAPPDLVPDIAQDVFLRVCRAAPAYRENGHFSTWLFQIALNAARDVARDAARRQRPTIAREEPVAFEPDPCERRELGELVARAVAELPLELREVLALRHDRGMSFEEMSRLLGTPASTLKSRFAVALNRLRRRLSDWGCAGEGGP